MFFNLNLCVHYCVRSFVHVLHFFSHTTRIVVVLEKFVYVYNFDRLERIRKYETTPNAKGIVALSPIDQCVLAFPHTTKGVVRVELLDANKSHLINAHEGNINCIALNMDGTRLATASEKGTLIRVFDTTTGQKLQEVRRGADKVRQFVLTGIAPFSAGQWSWHVCVCVPAICDNATGRDLLYQLQPRFQLFLHFIR